MYNLFLQKCFIELSDTILKKKKKTIYHTL